MSIGSWLFQKVGLYYSQETETDKHAYLCDFDRISHEIIPGDVLLIEGTNRISPYIKAVTHSPWTHAALYIGRIHNVDDPKMRQKIRTYYHGASGQQLIIDTVIGQGTFVKPLEVYKNHHVRICRPTGISHSDTQKVIDFVINHVGYEYDMRHFIDLARFLITNHWFIPRRWRSSLFYRLPTPTTKDICSSMIADAFLSIKFPILPLVRCTQDENLELIHRNPKLYAPADFDYSPYFSIIKYPIFRFSDHGPYHNLPWREDLVSNDEGIVIEMQK